MYKGAIIAAHNMIIILNIILRSLLGSSIQLLLKTIHDQLLLVDGCTETHQMRDHILSEKVVALSKK